MTLEQLEDKMFYLLVKIDECIKAIKRAEKAREELEQYRAELEQLAREYAKKNALERVLWWNGLLRIL